MCDGVTLAVGDALAACVRVTACVTLGGTDPDRDGDGDWLREPVRACVCVGVSEAVTVMLREAVRDPLWERVGDRD